MLQDNCPIVLHSVWEKLWRSRYLEIVFCWQCIQLSRKITHMELIL